MLPILLLHSQNSLGEEAKLPPVKEVRIAPPERWTIAPSAGEPAIDPTKPRKVKVGKAFVTVSPAAAFPEIDEVRPGTDGSLLIRRASRQVAWSRQSSIWFAGKETVVRDLDVEIYIDRRNYAGSFTTDFGGPQAFVVEGARRRALGPGHVRFWRSGGFFVLRVPVDAMGNPATAEEEEDVSTRVVDGKRSTVYPRFDFAGRTTDGSLFLARADGVLVQMRPDGGLLPWRLPSGWKVEGIFPKGEVLLRRQSPMTPMPEIPKDGANMDDWSQRMSAWQKTMAAETLANERDWSAAILRNGALHPLSFARPAKTENHLWRESEILGASAFRFTAFGGNERKTFRVTALK